MYGLFFNYIYAEYQNIFFGFIISLPILQAITYRFTEPSCGEVPYYGSSFLMHIQPCIIVECMLQTASGTTDAVTKRHEKLNTQSCPECFSHFVCRFITSHLNEIFKLNFSMYSVWNFMALFVRTCEYVFSDSIICFS